MNSYLPWVILFLPLVAAVLMGLWPQGTTRQRGVFGRGHCGFIWLQRGFVVLDSGRSRPAIGLISFIQSFTWLQVDKLHITFGISIDPLSTLMLLIVTGVGTMIHIYSLGYMRGDRSYSRFFAYLSFFTFSMIGLVLSDNFMQMFIFWELVGVSSYLLIGFWYERPAAADAAKKAFLTNRLGDFGFLTGIILIWAAKKHHLVFGSLETDFLLNPTLPDKMTTAGGILIFCGAVGKSAQFPLHVWLPDAMEGPTPVSALIHAATMVAAGVYMLCRVSFIFNAPALTFIAWTGGFTALLAALIAIQQNDIKRILAYSTLSQLGYMVMAVGLTRLPQGTDAGASGAPNAMFHLATHALFKALLFLGAGSVIHGLSHEQDIWKMGRLKDKMPCTAWTFLIGTLALCGIPPLSGFYSKDSILASAAVKSPMLFGIGVVVACLTTFYMFRLVFVVFWGKAKSDEATHAHESPRVMTYPLVVLAILSIIAGAFRIRHFVGRQFFMPEGKESILTSLLEPFQHDTIGPALCGLAAVVVGFFAARAFYVNAVADPLPAKLPFLCRAMRNKFYFDELYAFLIKITQDAMARLANLFDIGIVSGAVQLVHGGTELLGRGLRLAQTGNLQTYAFLSAAGAAVALYFVFRH